MSEQRARKKGRVRPRDTALVLAPRASGGIKAVREMGMKEAVAHPLYAVSLLVIDRNACT